MAQVLLATAGYDHTIKLWEAASGHCHTTLQHPESQVNKLEITPDKLHIAAAGNPLLRLFDLTTGTATSYDGHTNNVTAVGFQTVCSVGPAPCPHRSPCTDHAPPPHPHGAVRSPCPFLAVPQDGKWIYTGSEDGTIKIWDLRAPGCQREYESGCPINSVALHPNQSELISGDRDGNIRVWDLSQNACSAELVPDGAKAIRCVSVAHDATLLAAANDHGSVFVWRLGSGSAASGASPGATAGGAGSTASPAAEASAAASPPGSTASAGSVTDRVTKFEPLQKLQAHSTYITKCLISPDSRRLATASADHTVKVWDMVNHFSHERTLVGHQRWVWDAVFSADSAYLVTASSDQTARLWDVAQGDTIRHYTGHHKAVICAALHDRPASE